MSINSQYRSFVKQVQVDLLALCDADLFYTVQQWVDGNNAAEVSLDVPEETRFALGYTLAPTEVQPLSHSHSTTLDTENKETVQWHAPSPHHLRTLLTEMNMNVFAQHVITCAFKSLHATYPEWYDGGTFNAHLANYLRQMKVETANHDQSTKQSRSGKLL